MAIELNIKFVFKFIFCFILFLLCANILGLVSRLYFGHDSVHGLVPLFDFDKEQNIPTLYSSIALLICSVLTALISREQKKLSSTFFPWVGLSVVFLYLSIDETSFIHERAGFSTREMIGGTGLLYYSWIVPYGIAFLLFSIAYLKFLIDLPRKIMVLFVASGFTFILGALGFESLGGWRIELHGSEDVLYCIFYTCEEFLEMTGIAIFIYTLLKYIIDELGGFSLVISDNK